MEIVYKFSPIEVEEDFKLIGETFKRSVVDTGKGKREYKRLITDKGYDTYAKGIIDKAKYVHSHGMKDNVTLTMEQILVMKELIIYCVGLD